MRERERDRDIKGPERVLFNPPPAAAAATSRVSVTAKLAFSIPTFQNNPYYSLQRFTGRSRAMATDQLKPITLYSHASVRALLPVYLSMPSYQGW